MSVELLGNVSSCSPHDTVEDHQVEWQIMCGALVVGHAKYEVTVDPVNRLRQGPARSLLAHLPFLRQRNHLNVQEELILHSDLKRSLGRRPAVRDKAGLESRLRGYLRRLQRRPERVRAFFQAPTTRYAA